MDKKGTIKNIIYTLLVVMTLIISVVYYATDFSFNSFAGYIGDGGKTTISLPNSGGSSDVWTPEQMGLGVSLGPPNGVGYNIDTVGGLDNAARYYKDYQPTVMQTETVVTILNPKWFEHENSELVWYAPGEIDHLRTTRNYRPVWQNAILCAANGAPNTNTCPVSPETGIYRQGLEQLANNKDLSNWKSLVNDGTIAQSKALWGYFASASKDGASYTAKVSDRIQAYMKTNTLDWNNIQSWTEEQSHMASINYLDLLISLYSTTCQTLPDEEVKYAEAIDRYISEGVQPGTISPTCNIVLFPVAAIHIESQKRWMVTSIYDLWNYAFSVREENYISGDNFKDILQVNGLDNVSDIYDRLHGLNMSLWTKLVEAGATPDASTLMYGLKHDTLSGAINLSFGKHSDERSKWPFTLRDMTGDNTYRFSESLFIDVDGARNYGLNVIMAPPSNVPASAPFDATFKVIWTDANSQSTEVESSQQNISDIVQFYIDMKIKTEEDKAAWRSIFDKYDSYKLSFEIKSTQETGRYSEQTTEGAQVTTLTGPEYYVGGATYTIGNPVDVTEDELRRYLLGDTVYVKLNDQATKNQFINMGEIEQFGYDLRVNVEYGLNGVMQGKKSSQWTGWSHDKTDGEKFYHRVIAIKADASKIKYYSSPETFSEFKEGTVERNGNASIENYEAMAGVPSTETMYFTSGGSEFIIEMELQFIPQEKAIREYREVFFGTECEFKRNDQWDSSDTGGSGGAEGHSEKMLINNTDEGQTFESYGSMQQTIFYDDFVAGVGEYTDDKGKTIKTEGLDKSDKGIASQWFYFVKPSGAASYTEKFNGHDASLPKPHSDDKDKYGSNTQADSNICDSTTITAMWNGTIPNTGSDPGVTAPSPSGPTGYPCGGSPGVPGHVSASVAKSNTDWDLTAFDKALSQAYAYARAWEATNDPANIYGTAAKLSDSDNKEALTGEEAFAQGNTLRVWRIGDATLTVSISGESSNVVPRSYFGGKYTTQNWENAKGDGGMGSPVGDVEKGLGASYSEVYGSEASGSCSESGDPPKHQHGSWSGYKETKTKKVGNASYQIKVTFANGTLKAHELCGPCCSHDLPTIFDGWQQQLRYDYTRINALRVYKIHRSYVDDMEEITLVNYGDAEDKARNDFKLEWMHGAKAGRHEQITSAKQSGKHNGTDTLVAAISQGDPNIFYNIASMNPEYGNTMGSNKVATSPSMAGRIRYSYQANQHDWCYTEEMTRRGNMNYNELYNVTNGTRSNKCDGMGKTVCSKNMYSKGGRGHQEEWANGILYDAGYDAPDRISDEYWMATDFDSSFSAGYTSGKIEFHDDSEATTEWGTVERKGRGMVKTGYTGDSIDEKDRQTEEYRRFVYRRNQDNTAYIISDMLILQTSSGDQPVLWYTTGWQTKKLQQHFDYDEADVEKHKKGYNGHSVPLVGTTFQTSLEETWYNNRWCAYNWGDNNIGQFGDVNVGSYTGEYQTPNQKFSTTINTMRFGTLFDITGGSAVRGDTDATVEHPIQLIDHYFGPMAGGGDNENQDTEDFGANRADYVSTVKDYGENTYVGRQAGGAFPEWASSVEPGPARYADVTPVIDEVTVDNYKSTPNLCLNPSAEDVNLFSRYDGQRRMIRPQGLRIFTDEIVQDPTNPNKEYVTGEATQTYITILDYDKTKMFPHKFSMEPVYALDLDDGKTVDGFKLSAPYSREHDKINDIVVHDPVSVTDAAVLHSDPSHDKYDDDDENWGRWQEDFSKDSRVNNELLGASNLKKELDELQSCPRDPELCDFRVLNCSFDQDEVLASFDFETEYKDKNGNKKTGSHNDYIVNTVDGTQYLLPKGFEVNYIGTAPAGANGANVPWPYRLDENGKYIVPDWFGKVDKNAKTALVKVGDKDKIGAEMMQFKVQNSRGEWVIPHDPDYVQWSSAGLSDPVTGEPLNHYWYQNMFGGVFGNYLKCYGTRLSFDLAPWLGDYNPSTRVAVEFNFYKPLPTEVEQVQNPSASGRHDRYEWDTWPSKQTMLVSFNNYAFYLPEPQDLEILWADDNQNRSGAWTSGNGVDREVKKTNFIDQTMKVKLIFNFSDPNKSEVWINSQKAPYYAIKQEGKKLDAADIGPTLNIGSWNKDPNYPAAFYIDNLKITRLAEDLQHDASCYETVIQHATTVQYSCQKVDKYEYNVDKKGEPELFTAITSGKYKLEAFGAQGGGTSDTSQSSHGGLGGYTYGYKHLNRGDQLLIYPGGTGNASSGTGGTSVSIPGLVTKSFGGATWARVVYQKITDVNDASQFFSAADTAGQLSKNTPNLFSCLGMLNKFKSNGKFEFMLEYGERPGEYNRWTQTANPLDVKTNTGTNGKNNAPGFTPIHMDWTRPGYAQGLEFSGDGAILDGAVDHGNWWLAVGAFQNSTYPIPGAITPTQSFNCKEVSLWVRADGISVEESVKTYNVPEIGWMGTDGNYHTVIFDPGNSGTITLDVTHDYVIGYHNDGCGYPGSTYYPNGWAHLKDMTTNICLSCGHNGCAFDTAKYPSWKLDKFATKINTQGDAGFKKPVAYPDTSSAGWNGGGVGGKGGYGGGGASDIRLIQYGGIFEIGYGTDGRDGMTERGDLTYGPYTAAGKGHYQADIYGTGLSKCTFDAYTNLHPSIPYPFTEMRVTDTHVTLYFEVTDDLPAGGTGLEVRVRHDGVSNYSFEKSIISRLEDRILIAGGGGGADNTHVAGTLAGTADDGSGGAGGGLIAGHGYVGGVERVPGKAILAKLQPEVDKIKNSAGAWKAIDGVASSGCGLGAGQNYGYSLGVGESVSFTTDTGGAGGGLYGGYVTNDNNGGAGGGSGYLKDMDGDSLAGANRGQGLCIVSFLEHSGNTTGDNGEVNKVIGDFKYTGKTQRIKVPVSGEYMFEVWGASGGDARVTNTRTVVANSGGAGGYATGLKYLAAGTELFINVGGRGADAGYDALNKAAGGFNGGGAGGTEMSGEVSPENGAGGGGASDIRTSTKLEDRLIVAGGGGGAGSCLTGAGGAGGIAGLVTKDEDGKKWARILYQDISGNNNYFTTANMGNSSSANMFSALNQLEKFRGKDGKFEFMLEYPDAAKHAGKVNVWKQSKNPYTEQKTNDKFFYILVYDDYTKADSSYSTVGFEASRVEVATLNNNVRTARVQTIPDKERIVREKEARTLELNKLIKQAMDNKKPYTDYMNELNALNAELGTLAGKVTDAETGAVSDVAEKAGLRTELRDLKAKTDADEAKLRDMIQKYGIPDFGTNSRKYTGDVDGYVAIREELPGYSGHGLEFNGVASVLDGTIGYSNWWLAVGCMNTSYDATNVKDKDGNVLKYTMPGPYDEFGEGVSKVALWVRMDNLAKPLTGVDGGSGNGGVSADGERMAALGGFGGGLNGKATNTFTKGGGQKADGNNFGRGQDGYSHDGGKNYGSTGGGGGGYYGGTTTSTTNSDAYGGAGGSSYVDGLNSGSTLSGDMQIPKYDGSGTMLGNRGDGRVRISLMSSSNNGEHTPECEFTSGINNEHIHETSCISYDNTVLRQALNAEYSGSGKLLEKLLGDSVYKKFNSSGIMYTIKDFSNIDTRGFNLYDCTGSYPGDGMVLGSFGANPHIENPNVQLDPKSVEKIVVKMDYVDKGSIGNDAWLFFTTNADGTWTNDKCVKATYNSTSKSFTFDMSANSKWTGIITKLSLDPCQDGAKGSVKIKSIDFIGKGDLKTPISNTVVLKSMSNFSNEFIGSSAGSDLRYDYGELVVTPSFNGWEFRLPINISDATCLKAIRMTVQNNTSSTSCAVGQYNGSGNTYWFGANMNPNSGAWQEITIPVNMTGSLSYIDFDPIPGSAVTSGNIRIRKIELIGYGSASGDGVKTEQEVYTFSPRGWRDYCVAPEAGEYKIEAWGADGYGVEGTAQGSGGYSMGYVNLAAGEPVLAYVGKHGTKAGDQLSTGNSNASVSGYANGGGAGYGGGANGRGNGGGGGGGTFIYRPWADGFWQEGNGEQLYQSVANVAGTRVDTDANGAKHLVVNSGVKANIWNVGALADSGGSLVLVEIHGKGLDDSRVVFDTGMYSTNTSDGNFYVNRGANKLYTYRCGDVYQILWYTTEASRQHEFRIENNGAPVDIWFKSVKVINNPTLVAGGGGGSDDFSGAGNDGAGGNGGGLTGGVVKQDGQVVNRGNYASSTADGGGCGASATQNSGFNRYSGEPSNYNSDTAGGGGGYCGGYTTNHHNGGAGGGSGYIGGVYNGVTRAGDSASVGLDGLAKLYRIVNNPIVITPSRPSTLSIAYKPIMNLDGTEESIRNAIDEIRKYIKEIPDEIAGEYNPIFDCGRKYNHHNCDLTNGGCKDGIPVLNCNEPHHFGMHYSSVAEAKAHGHDFCYEACGIDENHIHNKDNLTNIENKDMIKQEVYVNTDEYFDIYFPNVGDFYESKLHGIGSTTPTRGMGYVDRMDTSEWTREKYVKFAFDTLFYREETQKWEQHLGGSWIELPVKGHSYPYYHFYCTLNNNEYSASTVEFDVEAINAKGYDSKYNYKNYMLNTEFAANDPKFFKQIKYSVNGKNTSTIHGGEDFVFKNYSIWGNNAGSASDHKNRNDNKVAQTNKDRRSTLKSYHGANKKYMLDVVGRIGNMFITDTDDLRFSNLFKLPKAGGEWLIDGIVREVYPNVQNYYLAWYYNNGKGIARDVRNRQVERSHGFYNTWFTQKWNGAYDDSPVSAMKGHALSMPLGSYDSNVHNPGQLLGDLLKPGYNINFEITSTGNYEDIVQVKPYFYALCIEDDPKAGHRKGDLTPVDVHMNTDSGYKTINFFGAVDNTKTWEQYQDKLFDYGLALRWSDEYQRRNYTEEEKVITERMRELHNVIRGDDTVEPIHIPVGDYYSLGNAQIIRANGYARTFIGTERTQYELRTFNGDCNTNFDKEFNSDDYGYKGQRWHLKLGIPSSSVFTFYENGKHLDAMDTVKYGGDSVKAYEIIGAPDDTKYSKYVIVMAANIKTLGGVWNLGYMQNVDENRKVAQSASEWSNGSVHINNTTYGFGYLGEKDKDGMPVPSEFRVVLAVYDAKYQSEVDFDIIGTH